ncbi:MAG: BrxA/BrxB family bacilliredoxin [Cytophagaceae bacterium]|nr:BrxA/BrxB family bacilliredoxin [Cytophagaceae bacterium]MDW8457333.1 BrxA/BrxB family bacilliredoxin [Cytophagaceae bacterium]
MYPEHLTKPMSKELTDIGFTELKTPEEVEAVLNQKEGTVFLVINSVCGCAAGAARPGVKAALSRTQHKPDKLVTVFAGVDKEAVQKAREYTLPYPPSSPSMAMFKNGELVHFIERHNIEGRSAEMIAQHLQAVFEEYCPVHETK